MKNLPTKNSTTNNLRTMICLFLFVTLHPSFLYSQNYRTINAYMDDFAKNELYVKKALMDYSVTIVESQLNSRTKTTAKRIIEKLEKVNTIMKNNNPGFKGNTNLRDSFINMNQKTIDCLKNGSLILNDYTYQSTLTFNEIGDNLNRKESELISYHQELKKFDLDKKAFAFKNKMHITNKKRKNILEYNAYQNILFYKMNVMDEKLTYIINAKDKKGFSSCLDIISLIHQEILIKTNLYKNEYKDTRLNDANIDYSNFITSQKDKLTVLFNNYVDAYTALQLLKKAPEVETNETLLIYNNAVKEYNTKKNLFYIVFNGIQTIKNTKYNEWLAINISFLRNNGQFYSIYEKYVYND